MKYIEIQTIGVRFVAVISHGAKRLQLRLSAFAVVEFGTVSMFAEFKRQSFALSPSETGASTQRLVTAFKGVESSNINILRRRFYLSASVDFRCETLRDSQQFKRCKRQEVRCGWWFHFELSSGFNVQLTFIFVILCWFVLATLWLRLHHLRSNPKAWNWSLDTPAQLSYIPIIGPLLYFVHSCWMASIYCFEWASQLVRLECLWTVSLKLSLTVICFAAPSRKYTHNSRSSLTFTLVFQVRMGAPTLVCKCSGRPCWGAWHHLYSFVSSFAFLKSSRHYTEQVCVMWLKLDVVRWVVIKVGASAIGCTSSASDSLFPSSAISAWLQASKPLMLHPVA